MEPKKVINKVVNYLKEEFSEESTGHDWFHIERVWKNAKLISEGESCNIFIVELGALLHDIADHKFVENANETAVQRINALLEPMGVSEDEIKAVEHIVLNCSFKGGVGENKMKSIEGLIVQDADRLDAIGAIGIARTFAFGGKFGNLIYDPSVKPVSEFQSEEAYRNNRTHTINHFYEKLLLLKDMMNTQTAKQIAKKRHEFMKSYLDQFYAEWEGKL